MKSILILIINDWLIKSAGILLIWIGILGHIFNYNFDKITGRSSDNYTWGWVQWVAFAVFWFLIYWGWIIRRCWKDYFNDSWEVSHGR